ncbi:MAG: GerMN domain-containing protein [Candidatus Aminicenantes bacterium]|jgi:germination protein M
METKKYIILGTLLALLVVLVVLFFQTGEEKRKRTPASSALEPEVSTAEVPETKTVQLFFLSEDDSLFHSEEREIFSDSSLVSEARQVVEELLKGSHNGYISPFPPQTKLRELFIIREGIVYVDFSREIQDKHLSGATAEVSTVYSVVNSLTYNFPPIKKVFLLVDGSEKETLKGHVDISRPLVPMYGLISR